MQIEDHVSSEGIVWIQIYLNVGLYNNYIDWVNLKPNKNLPNMLTILGFERDERISSDGGSFWYSHPR